MGILKRMLVVVVLSLGIALVLTAMTEKKEQDGLDHEQPAFGLGRTFHLTEQNLVDAVSTLSLSLPVGRVRLYGNELAVDLHLRSRDGVRSSDIYRDLYDLVDFALVSSRNIETLTVRVLSVEGQQREIKQLLLAMKADRRDLGDWPENRAEANTRALGVLLQSRFDMTYTQTWRILFAS